MGPHCCSCHCVVHPSSLFIVWLPCHSQRCGTWALGGKVAVHCGVHGGRHGIWIVSSGGARWLSTHWGGRKQPDSDDVACHCQTMLIASCRPCHVLSLCCGVPWSLWVVVAVGEHGDVVLVGIIDDGG